MKPVVLLLSAYSYFIPRKAKRKIRLIIEHASLYIGRRPRLKWFVLVFINRLPSLKDHLKGITSGTRGPNKVIFTKKIPVTLSHLTPRARQIYSDMKTAIDKSRQEEA